MDEQKIHCHGKLRKMVIWSIFLPQSPRDHFVYFPMEHLNLTGPLALRYKTYKAHFFTEGELLL